MHTLVSTRPSRLRHLLRVSLGLDELGRRIKQAREEANLTQQDLADRIGIKTAQSISRYERGQTEVTTKRLRQIAEATGKEMSFFVTLPEEVRPAGQDPRLAPLLEQAIDLLEELLAGRKTPPRARPAASSAHRG